MQYNLLVQDDFKSLTFVVDGDLHVVSSDHPRFDDVLKRVIDDDPSAVDLVEVVTGIRKGFEKVSDRVTIHDGTLLFDGDPINDALSKKILEFYEADEDYTPFVAFLEKLANNPSEHSRDSLFVWLEKHDFSLTRDGDFIAYKGLNKDFGSIHSGGGIVNGQPVKGSVPNLPGSVIEIARSTVDPNTFVGCSTGMHAGTYAYAHGFANGKLVTVAVNPRDVVAVPTDCDAQKIRTCRYYVIEEIEDEYDGLVYDYEDEDEYDDILPDEVTIDTTQTVDTRLNHKTQKRGPNGRFV